MMHDSELLKNVLGTYGNEEESACSGWSGPRGRSGAIVTVLPDGTVMKAGPPGTALGARIVSQGTWMTRHHNPALPFVHHVFRNRSRWGYTMERLFPAPLEALDGEKLATAVVRSLRTHFWCRPAEVKFDEARHAERLAPVIAPLTGHRLSVFKRLYESIEWDKLSAGLTHGDPIFDNVLFAPGGALVLSDPIAATPALPDVIALDAGRVLQSCAGYERVTYAGAVPDEKLLDRMISSFELSHNDLAASLYFGVVHLLRAVVYVPAATARQLLDRCVDRLMGAVTCRW